MENQTLNKKMPAKLKPGDTIRVVAPSESMGILSEATKKTANSNLLAMGLKVSFGKHITETDDFLSSSIESRVEDLHDAFKDSAVKAIFTVIGGFNCNQLLRYLDWGIIGANPKIFCGFSDITALNNAIYTKTGLVSYSGPHYSTFGQPNYLDYTIDYFKKCLFSDEQFEIKPNDCWLDDKWWTGEERHPSDNDGWLTINEGKAAGTILGANLCTFNLLQGTEYFPNLENSVLFIEDDEETNPVTFDRNLQSLIHQPGFAGVKGLVIGRFQKASEINQEKLIKIIKTKKELDNLPVVAGVDFGHTEPKITFPVGGTAEIVVNTKESKIKILEH